MLIAIPTGVKIFNWIATMAQGAIRFTTAMLFGIALVALFTIGGISGVMHASPPADLQQTDTYFIVAHFHYVLFGGSIMGIFAGIYHYFPKITGRLMDEKLGKVHFWLTFIAMNLTFFPMHFSGMLGMPRRIYTYDSGQGWDLYNAMSTAGAMMLPDRDADLHLQLLREQKARRDRRTKSMGSRNSGVDDSEPAARVQLRQDPDGDEPVSDLGREGSRPRRRAHQLAGRQDAG